MYRSNPGDRWDEKEKKMDEADMNGEEPKVEVTVHTDPEKEDNNFPMSGLFCCLCHNHAIYIYDCMSLCHECFNKETADLIKNRKK